MLGFVVGAARSLLGHKRGRDEDSETQDETRVQEQKRPPYQCPLCLESGTTVQGRYDAFCTKYDNCDSCVRKCIGCNNAVCRGCAEEWGRSTERKGKPLTCPLCRKKFPYADTYCQVCHQGILGPEVKCTDATVAIHGCGAPVCVPCAKKKRADAVRKNHKLCCPVCNKKGPWPEYGVVPLPRGIFNTKQRLEEAVEKMEAQEQARAREATAARRVARLRDYF